MRLGEQAAQVRQPLLGHDHLHVVLGVIDVRHRRDPRAGSEHAVVAGSNPARLRLTDPFPRASTNGVNDRGAHPVPAFDERRALADLEKLHREIQRARVQRDRAEAEFDKFVRGFREQEVEAEVGTKGERSMRAPEPVHATAHEDSSPAAAPATRRAARVAVALLIVVAALAAVLAVRAWRTRPDLASQPAQPSDTPAAAGIRPQPSAPPPVPVVEPRTPAAPAPPAGVNLELLTRRAVWMRVTIDGRRALEREVPAGERIPLRAQRAVAIRAGDAGAVAVTIDGRDAGVLGRDGAIVTRVFTMTPDPDGAGRR